MITEREAGSEEETVFRLLRRFDSGDQPPS